jgi:hypothetical protein
VGSSTGAKPEGYVPPVVTNQPIVLTKDPMLEHFRIVDSKELLWAPPVVPEPFAFDLLPPGAQFYIWLRPADLLSNKSSMRLVESLKKQFQLGLLFDEIATQTGQPIESLASVIVAYYNAGSPELFPSTAIRAELITGQSIEQLKANWKATSEAVVNEERLFVADNDRAFYVPKNALAGDVKVFCSGPSSLLREAAEMAGGTAPLIAPFKLLQGKTSRQNQLIMLGSPRYLFTEGRGLTRQLPMRLQNLLEPVLSKDARAALFQINFAERCYWELQLVAATDGETPRLVNRLSERSSGAATEIENWFVTQSPHPYWRALAFRFPQMLRTWREYSRFGVEDGVGLANGYLPADATSNLIVASWIASQEASTMAGELANVGSTPTPGTPTMTPEEVLNRPIRLTFDQEPIERALALVGEEANAGVPAASQLRFELDGKAFETAGFTRNQQLKDFKLDNQPVRNALTEIATRGNPITTVKDTRELDQRMIWVVKDDPQNAGKKMVSLTSRDAAKGGNIALSVEFAPEK